MKKSAFILSIFLIFSVFISGCAQESTETNNKNDELLQIYTTVYPLQYFSEQIGGEYVHVETIYPPGADEHTFEPSQKDMMALADSDLFFYVGLGLEGFVDKAINTLKNENVKMVAVGEEVHLPEEAGHDEEEADNSEHESHGEEGSKDDHDSHSDDEHHTHTEDEQDHAHGGIDPHIWLDPVYANELALAIKDQLSEEMPDHKETFEKNYARLSDQLYQLDQQFTDVIDSAKRKEFIVSHSAYTYWELRYGVEQISISGQSTTNEPSQKELKNLIAHAKEEKIKYVIKEQNFDSKLSKIVQNEIGAESLTFHNLSVLTDEDIKDKATYFSLMEDNLATLEKALNE
jgi:zinc transport system substrate-binding protein